LKLSALTTVALVAVALAMPALAQANAHWYTSGEPDVLMGEEGEAEVVEGEGEISLEAGFLTGPTSLHFGLSVWNGATMGEGQVDTAIVTSGTITTSLPNCDVTTVSANASHSTPWPVTLTTGASSSPAEIVIGSASDPVTITEHYSAGCAAYAIPTFVSASGLLTGIVDPATGCIKLSKPDDLRIERPPPGNVQVNLSGEICLPSVTGY